MQANTNTRKHKQMQAKCNQIEANTSKGNQIQANANNAIKIVVKRMENQHFDQNVLKIL